jgi:serine phosphatase RsbU (regulator of sigma subunit)
LANIGKIQISQNRVNEGIKNCEIALKLSLGNSFPENTKTCYDCLYEANKKNGDSKSALKYFEKFISITDSLKNSSIENQLARKEIEFEYQMKTVADSVKISEERKVVAAQLKVEQTKRYALYIGILILLAFGYFISNRLKITRRQKAIIEKQKQEVVHQKELVDEKNKEILDSINYAKRIQTAILPPKRIVKEYLPNSFILYKPKDIVAGDFYWMESKGDFIMFAAADCTGHGVPGAMVSVICNNGLNRSVKEFGIIDSGKILDKAREIVVNEFEKSDEEVKDGMDISLCVLNTKTKQLQWSGANNPLWIVRAHPNPPEGRESQHTSQTNGFAGSSSSPLGRLGGAVLFEYQTRQTTNR